MRHGGYERRRVTGGGLDPDDKLPWLQRSISFRRNRRDPPFSIGDEFATYSCQIGTEEFHLFREDFLQHGAIGTGQC